MNELATVAQMFSLMRYTQTISTSITLYDHLCTVDAEVKYIWVRFFRTSYFNFSTSVYPTLQGKRWSSSKILFIATRYIGDLLVIFTCYCEFMSRPSQNVCSVAYNIVIVGGTSSLMFLCQAILCYRLSALYNNNKHFVRTISLMFLLEVSGTVTFVICRLKNSYDLHGTSLCLLVHGNTTSVHAESAYWITIILFETIILSLTLWKFIFDIRLTPALRRSSLSRLIVRDNILYYSAAFVLYFSVGVTARIFKTRLNSIVSSCFVPAFSTTVGCRLILHLSEVHEHDVHGRRNVWTSDIRITPFGVQYYNHNHTT
ncbi:hypothetical protein BDQ17DRAFT_843245 [Cyathus striatus]|nr:hypothetical protein BDQ17DRAFT_843245 [Cyathus striatus]